MMIIDNAINKIDEIDEKYKLMEVDDNAIIDVNGQLIDNVLNDNINENILEKDELNDNINILKEKHDIFMIDVGNDINELNTKINDNNLIIEDMIKEKINNIKDIEDLSLSVVKLKELNNTTNVNNNLLNETILKYENDKIRIEKLNEDLIKEKNIREKVLLDLRDELLVKSKNIEDINLKMENVSNKYKVNLDIKDELIDKLKIDITSINDKLFKKDLEWNQKMIDNIKKNDEINIKKYTEEIIKLESQRDEYIKLYNDKDKEMKTVHDKILTEQSLYDNMDLKDENKNLEIESLKKIYEDISKKNQSINITKNKLNENIVSMKLFHDKKLKDNEIIINKYKNDIDEIKNINNLNNEKIILLENEKINELKKYNILKDENKNIKIDSEKSIEKLNEKIKILNDKIINIDKDNNEEKDKLNDNMKELKDKLIEKINNYKTLNEKHLNETKEYVNIINANDELIDKYKAIIFKNQMDKETTMKINDEIKILNNKMEEEIKILKTQININDENNKDTIKIIRNQYNEEKRNLLNDNILSYKNIINTENIKNRNDNISLNEHNKTIDELQKFIDNQNKEIIDMKEKYRIYIDAYNKEKYDRQNMENSFVSKIRNEGYELSNIIINKDKMIDNLKKENNLIEEKAINIIKNNKIMDMEVRKANHDKNFSEKKELENMVINLNNEINMVVNNHRKLIEQERETNKIIYDSKITELMESNLVNNDKHLKIEKENEKYNEENKRLNDEIINIKKILNETNSVNLDYYTNYIKQMDNIEKEKKILERNKIKLSNNVKILEDRVKYLEDKNKIIKTISDDHEIIGDIDEIISNNNSINNIKKTFDGVKESIKNNANIMMELTNKKYEVLKERALIMKNKIKSTYDNMKKHNEELMKKNEKNKNTDIINKNEIFKNKLEERLKENLKLADDSDNLIILYNNEINEDEKDILMKQMDDIWHKIDKNLILNYKEDTEFRLYVGGLKRKRDEKKEEIDMKKKGEVFNTKFIKENENKRNVITAKDISDIRDLEKEIDKEDIMKDLDDIILLPIIPKHDIIIKNKERKSEKVLVLEGGQINENKKRKIDNISNKEKKEVNVKNIKYGYTPNTNSNIQKHIKDEVDKVNRMKNISDIGNIPVSDKDEIELLKLLENIDYHTNNDISLLVNIKSNIKNISNLNENDKIFWNKLKYHWEITKNDIHKYNLIDLFFDDRDLNKKLFFEQETTLFRDKILNRFRNKDEYDIIKDYLDNYRFIYKKYGKNNTTYLNFRNKYRKDKYRIIWDPLHWK